MRKNHLFVLAALCSAALAFGPISVTAQTTNTPAPQMAPTGTPPPPRMNPAARNLMSLRGAVAMLDRAMGELQRNDNDFGGHRQTAIDACAKARAELVEIAKEAGLPLAPQRGMPGSMQRPGGVPPPPAARPEPLPAPAQPQ